MNQLSQAQQAVAAQASSSLTKVSKKSNGVDFKSFLKDQLQSLTDVTVALTDDDKTLNIPQLGVYNVKGDDKLSLANTFAVGQFTQEVQNIHSLVMDLYLDTLKLEYDEVNKLFSS